MGTKGAKVSIGNIEIAVRDISGMYRDNKVVAGWTVYIESQIIYEEKLKTHCLFRYVLGCSIKVHGFPGLPSFNLKHSLN